MFKSLKVLGMEAISWTKGSISKESLFSYILLNLFAKKVDSLYLLLVKFSSQRFEISTIIIAVNQGLQIMPHRELIQLQHNHQVGATALTRIVSIISCEILPGINGR